MIPDVSLPLHVRDTCTLTLIPTHTKRMTSAIIRKSLEHILVITFDDLEKASKAMTLEYKQWTKDKPVSYWFEIQGFISKWKVIDLTLRMDYSWSVEEKEGMKPNMVAYGEMKMAPTILGWFSEEAQNPGNLGMRMRQISLVLPMMRINMMLINRE